jgi:hypothetical protein
MNRRMALTEGWWAVPNPGYIKGYSDPKSLISEPFI